MFFSDYSECSVSKTCNWQFIRWKNKSHIWFLSTLKNDHVQSLKQSNLFNKVMNISWGHGRRNKTLLHVFFLLCCFLTDVLLTFKAKRKPLLFPPPCVYPHSSNQWLLLQAFSKGKQLDLATMQFWTSATSSCEWEWGESPVRSSDRGSGWWDTMKSFENVAPAGLDKSTAHPLPSERPGKCTLGGTALGVRINPPRCPWWQSSPIWSIQQHH